MKHTMSIKGKDWTFELMSDKKYEKKHGVGSNAITLLQEREVNVKKSGCNFSNICHETCHIFLASSLIESASLTAYQMEEVMCEIFGAHYFDIGYVVGEVLNKFLIPKKKPLTNEE